MLKRPPQHGLFTKRLLYKMPLSLLHWAQLPPSLDGGDK